MTPIFKELGCGPGPGGSTWAKAVVISGWRPPTRGWWPRVWEAWARKPFSPGTIWTALWTTRLPALSGNRALLSAARLAFGPCDQEFFRLEPAGSPRGYPGLWASVWLVLPIPAQALAGRGGTIVARGSVGPGFWSRSLCDLQHIIPSLWASAEFPHQSNAADNTNSHLFPQVVYHEARMSSCREALCSLWRPLKCKGLTLREGASSLWKMVFWGSCQTEQFLGKQQEFFPLIALVEDPYCLLGLRPSLQALCHSLRNEVVT